MAGQSVLDFLKANGELIQSTSYGQDVRVPKADGGYDFYRILPDNSITSISAKDVGGGMNPPISPTVPTAPADTQQTDTGATTGGTTTGGGVVFTPQYVGNVLYTDPVAYQQAVTAQAQQNYNTQMQGLNTSYNQGLSNYANQFQQLGVNKDATLQNQNAYFNSISPDAMQSQQGVYQGKVNDQYNQSANQMNQDKLNMIQNYQNQVQGLNTTAQTNMDSLATQGNQYGITTPTFSYANPQTGANPLSGLNLSVIPKQGTTQYANMSDQLIKAGHTPSAVQQFLNQ